MVSKIVPELDPIPLLDGNNHLEIVVLSQVALNEGWRAKDLILSGRHTPCLLPFACGVCIRSEKVPQFNPARLYNGNDDFQVAFVELALND